MTCGGRTGPSQSPLAKTNYVTVHLSVALSIMRNSLFTNSSLDHNHVTSVKVFTINVTFVISQVLPTACRSVSLTLYDFVSLQLIFQRDFIDNVLKYKKRGKSYNDRLTCAQAH